MVEEKCRIALRCIRISGHPKSFGVAEEPAAACPALSAARACVHSAMVRSKPSPLYPAGSGERFGICLPGGWGPFYNRSMVCRNHAWFSLHAPGPVRVPQLPGSLALHIFLRPDGSGHRFVPVAHVIRRPGIRSTGPRATVSPEIVRTREGTGLSHTLASLDQKGAAWTGGMTCACQGVNQGFRYRNRFVHLPDRGFRYSGAAKLRGMVRRVSGSSAGTTSADPAHVKNGASQPRPYRRNLP